MTSSLDIPAETRAAMRDAARDAAISAARLFGFGGEQWSVARPSGVGMAARTLVPVSGAVTALAFRQRPGGLAPAAGGAPVLADIWRMIVISGELLPGDVLTSVDDARYRVGIASVEVWYEYHRAELERIR